MHKPHQTPVLKLYSAVLLALALVLALGLAGAAGAGGSASAADRVIGFDTAPAPSPGGTLKGEYHSLGVDFADGPGDIRTPVIAVVGTRARSGTRVAGERCGVDFCAQDIAGSFTQTHTRVRVRVGLLDATGPNRTFTLFALGLDGREVGRSSASVSAGSAFGTALEVATAARSIAGFRITPGTPAATDWGIDDLMFDIPATVPAPDYALTAYPPPAGFVRPGETIAVPIHISHLNGSVGSVGLAVSGLPAGVAAVIAPSSTPGAAATLTLTAAKSAVPSSDVVVMITGTPASAAVGSIPRTTTFTLRVANAGAATIDVAHVTQGLDHDVRAGVDYDLVAGKDTLVRARLWGVGAPLVDAAECRIKRAGTLVATIPAKWTGAGPARASVAPTGVFDGSPTFDCWIPGADLRVPGEYTFGVYMRLKDALGELGAIVKTAKIEPSADIRLLIYPWTVRPVDPNYRAYTPASDAIVDQTLADFQRIWPTRAGVGPLRMSPPKPGEILPGVRFVLLPPYACPLSSATSTLACDLETRNNAQLALTTWNETATYDNVDWAYALAQSAASGGGSSCWSGRTLGGAQDLRPRPTSTQANILVQELAHCLGAVDPSSPNSDPANTSHARTQQIPMTAQPAAVDMLMRTDVPTPTSVMFPFVTRDATAFFEGREWNQVRTRTATTSVGVVGGGFSPFIAAQGRTFVWMGSVNRRGDARLQYAYVRAGAPDPDVGQAEGRFELRVSDGRGHVLARRPVSAAFDEPHEQLLSAAAVFTEVPLPKAAATVVLADGPRVLYRTSVRGAAPVVDHVRLKRSRGGLLVQWGAHDTDLQPLRYSIRFEAAKQPPLVLAAGLEHRSYLLPTRYLDPTRAARVVIEASDGLHTGRASSPRFAVPAR